jgi:hypothetical protein
VGGGGGGEVGGEGAENERYREGSIGESQG